MGGSDPGSAREEAERLVAMVLAMARLTARGQGQGPDGLAGLGAVWDLLGVAGPIATGEPACRACPICRVITALRDPSPEFAERLATGAGDFAAGVASLMRALAPTADGPTADGPTGPDIPSSRSPGPDDEVWREATHGGDDSDPAGERDVWSVATHTPVDVAGASASPDRIRRAPNRPMARKAVRGLVTPGGPDEPGQDDPDGPGDRT